MDGAAGGGESIPELNEVLPKAGLVYSEKGALSDVLCKVRCVVVRSLATRKPRYDKQTPLPLLRN
jgi:hypothetical protein